MNIDEDSFEEYFFDARRHKPQRGQVLAVYAAMADFVDGFEKRQLIDLMQKTDKCLPAAQVMRKLCHAVEPDCYRVPREMSEDLAAGMTEDEVAEKPYRYKVEIFYYTQVEYIPKDDDHWSCVSLLNLDHYLGKINGEILEPKEAESEDAADDEEAE